MNTKVSGVRKARNRIGELSFRFSLWFAMCILALLFITIIDDTITMVAIENTIEPSSLSDKPLEKLSSAELVTILGDNVRPNRLRVLLLENGTDIPQSEWADTNERFVKDIFDHNQYPEELSQTPFKELSLEQTLSVLPMVLSRDTLEDLVWHEIVEPRVVRVYNVSYAVIHHDDMEEDIRTHLPRAKLSWKIWLSKDFLERPMHSVPELSGIRTAILGSLLVIFVTILFAFPVSVGAAIYLEIYAQKNWLNRLIETNISTLAGVPSIIYGILGLVVFVRWLEPLTSGGVFGRADTSVTASGRTILSAGMTLGILILPIMIASSREAIRAVPPSLVEASYGVGATTWQTIRSIILPQAFPGILTGTILSISRAFGETAPLVVVGSITRITVDPTGPFSRFTVIPIQIYTWTSQPEDAFRSTAAATILVLLGIIFTLNIPAIILRNRMSGRL